MKLKYYLRGLGVGIVVTAFIMSITSANKNEKLTDAQIIQKAQELGMVTADDYNSVSSELSDEKTNVSDLKSQLENVDETQDTKQNADQNAQQNSSDAKTDQSAQQNSSNAKTDQNAEAAIANTSNADSSLNNVTTQETNIDGSVSETTTVNFDIIPGMGSESVAKLLEQKGIIDSASDFNSYIVNSGNANNLQIGEYDVMSGDSYDTILGKIIGR